MNYLRLLPVALVVVFAGWAHNVPSAHGAQGAQSAPVVVSDDHTVPVVTMADTVNMVFPTKYPHNLVVQTPSGESYIVRNDLYDINLLPPTAFGTQVFTFAVADLKGATWEDITVTPLLFQDPGEYLFYFAEVIETEPENTDFTTRTVRLQY